MARKNVNITVTMETDTVFIGDICYALDEGIYHEKWGECLGWADGEIRAEGNSDIGPVCAVVGSTATGDGCYEGSDGTVFGVDAGVIGVTNLKYLRNDENVESLNQLGKVIDIPGGECFVTLVDEGGEFYISIEDMQHNKIYSVNIPTGALEIPTCIECGAEISDFENYQYGGVCEDCYRYQDYEDEEDLDECCTANCNSGEFQRMAPGKVVSMTAYKGSKKALGKKDKYNRLGESNKLAEATGSFPIRKVAASPRWITDTGKETIWITAEINGIPCAFPFIAGYGPTAEGCDCNECIVNYEMQFYNRDRIDTSKGKRIGSVADGGGSRYYFLKFGESILKSMPKENQKDFRFTGHYYSTRPLVTEFKKLITTAFNTDLLTEEFKSAIGL